MDELLGAALDAAVARALGHAEGAITYSMPSFALQLQRDHDIAVYPDEYASSPETKWVAGFDVRAKFISPPEMIDPGVFLPGKASIELDHEARGETPEIAICRAIVLRGEAQRQREDLRATAWHRAEVARMTRTPHTEFDSEAERVAYNKALDEQLDFIKSRNPDLYPKDES